MKTFSIYCYSVFLLLATFAPQATQAQTKQDIQKNYKYRKYGHVKKLYKRLATPITELCIKHKLPPAAVLSIISLESGWGNGYIGKITGNFMSLNTRLNDTQLPALTMPKNKKTGAIILSQQKLASTPKTNIVWQKRPSSLKKDYRPEGIAGTTENLDYFLNHPNELTAANIENVRDFATKFIAYTSGIRAYREARKMLDEEIEKNGIEILFDYDLNNRFIYTIGGRPSSFNFRKTWPKKVMSILRNVGAHNLTKDIYVNHKTFNEAW